MCRMPWGNISHSRAWFVPWTQPRAPQDNQNPSGLGPGLGCPLVELQQGAGEVKVVKFGLFCSSWKNQTLSGKDEVEYGVHGR